MHTEALIKLCVQRTLRNSVRGLAEELGLNNVSINDWKLGYKPIPEERIRQLAKFAGEDPGHWLLLIKSEQEKGDLGKEWAKLYKRLTATAATLIAGADVSSSNAPYASIGNKEELKQPDKLVGR
ncbi:DUF3693 domain-containing protein, partial [Xylella fastidiosa]|uniref:DUF3693 domain-containing protein n=1 Tax=Xylella fastidiosa TaxID=2371 RepID=UPI0023628C74